MDNKLKVIKEEWKHHLCTTDLIRHLQGEKAKLLSEATNLASTDEPIVLRNKLIQAKTLNDTIGYIES